jgi:hypothetical protein
MRNSFLRESSNLRVMPALVSAASELRRDHHHDEGRMPAKRELTMRYIRYTLQLASERISARQIGRMLGVARNTIQDNLKRAQVAGLAWLLPADLTADSDEVAQGSEPRPTIRSSAAILASYSCSRSATCTLSSRAPASYLPTQTRISCRDISCRFDNPCRVSPATYSCATCRLKVALRDRCLVMAFILRKPSTNGQIKSPLVSTFGGALRKGVLIPRRFTSGR